MDRSAYLSVLFERSPQAIALSALPDGRIIDANPAYCRIVGLSREVLIGRTAADFNLWVDTDLRKRLLERLARGEPVLRETMQYRTSDGRIAWAALSIEPAVFSGQPGFITMAEEITERVRAEESLRKLSLAVEQSPDAVIITDRQGLIEYVNEAFTRSTGYGASEVVGHNPRLLKSGQTPAATYESLWTELLAGRAWQGEFINRRKDGSELIEFARITPLRGADGATTHYVAVKHDITQRKQLTREVDLYRHQLQDLVDQRTQALREANERFERFMAVSPGGYAIVSGEGVIEYLNPGFISMFGYQISSMPTMDDWWRLAYPDPVYRADRMRSWQSQVAIALQRDGIIRGFVGKVRTLAGKDVWAESYAAVTEEKVHIVLLDITERRLIEDKVKDLNLSLADRVRQAEAASHSKSAFLANMSHEIRTPMNVIIGLTHLLQRDHPSAAQQERLHKIGSAGAHLLGIINDVLDISRIEADKLSLDSVDFKLDAVVDGVASILGPQAAERGVALSTRISGDAGWLRGDPMRLRQVLLNLAGNALKFTRQGSVDIEVHAGGMRDGHITMRCEVRDTGTGIAADRVGQVFRAYEQADAGTAREFGGTGLGLAISKRLVELMGGEIGVQSTPGQGSTFWFTANFEPGRSPLDQGLVAVGPGDAEIALRTQFGDRRLLLVEDNETNREIAHELLRAAGLQVDCASDGREALERVCQQRYDLVLMDMQMPRMDGLEATRRLRALDGWSDVPIIAMTANAFAEDRRRCREAGMSDFVAKPVDADVLYSAVLRALASASVRGGRAADGHAEVPGAPRQPPARASMHPTECTVGILERISGLDIEAGLRVAGNDPARLLRLLRVFVTGRRNDSLCLREALESRDAEQLKFVAHSLKGSATSLGLSAVGNGALKLERALVGQHPWPQVAEVAQTLLAALDKVETAVRDAVV